MDKLSIIIPVHNSERYLERCIQSVISQTYTNIEIILIENNSTDGSFKICEKYAKKDPRIRIVVEKKVELLQLGIVGCILQQENI